MNMQSVQAFLKKMKTDEEFAKKITAEIAGEVRVALAHEADITISSSEITAALGELSDDELDDVAGGMVNQILTKVYFKV